MIARSAKGETPVRVEPSRSFSLLPQYRGAHENRVSEVYLAITMATGCGWFANGDLCARSISPITFACELVRLSHAGVRPPPVPVHGREDRNPCCGAPALRESSQS